MPVVVDLLGPLADQPEIIDEVLRQAVTDHRLVYYHGHSQRGRLRGFALGPELGYRLLVIDTCYSTQLYAGDAGGSDDGGAAGGDAASSDRIVNRGRSVTGSVGSFIGLFDGALAELAPRGSSPARSWADLLDDMNRRAVERAQRRAPHSELRDPERYGRAQRCAPRAAAGSPSGVQGGGASVVVGGAAGVLHRPGG